MAGHHRQRYLAHPVGQPHGRLGLPARNDFLDPVEINEEGGEFGRGSGGHQKVEIVDGFDERNDEQSILSKIWGEMFDAYPNEKIKNILLNTVFVSWTEGVLTIRGIGAAERFLISMEEKRILAYIQDALSENMSNTPQNTTALVIR